MTVPVRNQELDDDIIRRYIWMKQSLRQIAEATYTSATFVKMRLLDNGIRMRKRGGPRKQLAHEEYERTAALYRSGMRVMVMAEELGICVAQVYTRLELAGERRRTAAESHAASVQTRIAEREGRHATHTLPPGSGADE